MTDYKILTDTHTHTIASDHVYSTLLENVRYAREAGLELIAMTDHGPDLMDAPHEYHFTNSRILPRTIEGVTVLKGAEVNIIDYDGSLDLPDGILEKLELVIASLHEYVLRPGTTEQHNRVWRSIAQNPLVDIIGHSGQDSFQYDYEAIMPLFKANNKIVEINSSSPVSRPGALENCINIARLCKQYGVWVTLGSDAHFCTQIGQHEVGKKILREVDFPEELIVNANQARLLRFLSEKKGLAL